MGRGLIIALILSLAVNVFAVGFIAGRLISEEKPAPQAQANNKGGLESPLRMMRYAETLPPEIRDDFREKIREQLPTLRRQQREVRRIRGEIVDLLAADEWDRDAVMLKAAEMAQAQERQRQALYAAFINAFEMLPAEDRKQLTVKENRRRLEHEKRRRNRQRPAREE